MGLPYFFFGTLMDGDVLARVLARPVAPTELTPALLWGHRRHAVLGTVYPMLRPDPSGHVAGVVFHPAQAEERARIDHFEADEYVAAPHRVQIGTRLGTALVYVGLDGVLRPAAAGWCLATWRASHKADYLRRCDGWMADYEPVLGTGAEAADADAGAEFGWCRQRRAIRAYR